MSKLIAFSGSNSSNSINQALVNAIGKNNDTIKVIDLRDYEVPMYGMDLETSAGVPDGVKQIMQEILDADGAIIATPEHNSMPPAFFKNILDWLSRTGVKYLEGKSVLVMSSSPGNGGGKSAAEYVTKVLGYAGAKDVKRFTLPRFGETFDQEASSIVDADLKNELETILAGM